MTIWSQSSYSQCREDNSWEDVWTSCQTSPSPNPIRTQSHWLQYDLGHLYPLASLHIWNANQPDLTDRGIREMILDYSEDGQAWTEWGMIQVPQAPGKNYYSGFQVADFGVLRARYLLFTVTQSWGASDCVSLHEVSMKVAPFPLPEDQQIWLYPNPSREQVTVRFEMNEWENIQLDVLTLIGQSVWHEELSVERGEHRHLIHTGDLVPGVYLVYVRGRGGRVIGVEKLVVSKS